MKIPVVLLHGALRSSWGLLPAALYLRRAGFDARACSYRTRKGTLEHHAARVRDFIARWLPSPPPVLGFLTHSMGGLVARAYLGDFACSQTEYRVVMLSPPNEGSQLAARYSGWRSFEWLYGDAAGELLPTRVRRLPQPGSSARVLVLAGGRGDPRGYHPHLSGDDDGVVALAEMGLPGVEPLQVGGVHSMLQFRPGVLRVAAEFLRQGELPRPQPLGGVPRGGLEPPT